MAEVIDALFFELGITGDFDKQADQALVKLEDLDAAFDQLEGKLNKNSKATSANSVAMAKSNKALANNEKQTKQNVKVAKDFLEVIKDFTKVAGALATVITVGFGLDKLANEAAKANKELDNTAKNVGISTNALSSWRSAAEMAGGSADGMSSYLNSLSSSITNMVVMGDTSLVPFFNALGVSVLDSSGKTRNLNDVLLDLSDSMSKMDRVQAHGLAKSMGMDEETFNFLIQGREVVEDYLSKTSKLYKSNADDIETSRKLTAATSYLNQQFDSLQLMIANAVTPVLLKVAEITTKFFEFLQKHEDLVKGVFFGIATALGTVLIPMLWRGVAAVFAFMAPFLPVIAIVGALGLAFGALYDDYKKWSEGGASLFNWGVFIKWIDSADFSIDNLKAAFTELITGYKSWGEALDAGKQWLELKGFTKDGEMSIDSLITGFKNLTDDLIKAVIPTLQKVGKTISKLLDGDFEGAWEGIKSLGEDGVNYVVDSVKEQWAKGVRFWDRATGHDPDAEGSLTQSIKTGEVLNKQGFNGAENNLIKEMNNLGYSDEEKAMFIATVRHESANYSRLRENGKYRSVEQMQKANIKRAIDDPEGARRAIAQGEDAIFEFMYGGRMGNNDVGDGAKYRGRGILQITGKSNYERIGKQLGVDLVNNPELLETDPDLSIRAAMVWWENKKKENAKFSKAIKDGDFKAVTYGVNGGYNGMSDRLAKYNSVMRDLNQPLGGVEVANAIKAAQPNLNNMQNLAQGQNSVTNNKTDIVLNGGITVNSSSSTVTGTISDAADALSGRVATLNRYNYGVN